MGNIFKEHNELQLIEIVKEPETHSSFLVDYAKGEIYKSHEKLIYTIARKYVNEDNELQDLVMEGARGLWIAVNKYNKDSGVKLATYAYLWIQEAMRRSIEKDGKAIRLPSSAKQDIWLLAGVQNEFFNEHGYKASVEEIAKILGWKTSKVLKTISYGKCIGSLDKIISDDDSRKTSFADMVEDENANPHDALLKEEQQSELSVALKSVLNEQQYQALSMQLGFNGQKQMSISAIAKAMNKSVPRIKQILKSAKDKLQSSEKLREIWVGYKN